MTDEELYEQWKAADIYNWESAVSFAHRHGLSASELNKRVTPFREEAGDFKPENLKNTIAEAVAKAQARLNDEPLPVVKEPATGNKQAQHSVDKRVRIKLEKPKCVVQPVLSIPIPLPKRVEEVKEEVTVPVTKNFNTTEDRLAALRKAIAAVESD